MFLDGWRFSERLDKWKRVQDVESLGFRGSAGIPRKPKIYFVLVASQAIQFLDMFLDIIESHSWYLLITTQQQSLLTKTTSGARSTMWSLSLIGYCTQIQCFIIFAHVRHISWAILGVSPIFMAINCKIHLGGSWWQVQSQDDEWFANNRTRVYNAPRLSLAFTFRWLVHQIRALDHWIGLRENLQETPHVS